MGCYNSIVIDLPASDVWSRVNNFHDMSWSKNVISHLSIIGSKLPPDPGARRVLNEVFFETLLSYDNEEMVFMYSLDDGPDVLSVKNIEGFVGSLQVFPIAVDNTCLVLWTSTWSTVKFGDVAEFCNPIYHALLEDMKATLESEIDVKLKIAS